MRSAPTPLDQFLNDLGGTGKVAALTNRRPSAVSNWRITQKIPPELFVLLSRVAEEAGVEAKPEFFGMTMSSEAAE